MKRRNRIIIGILFFGIYWLCVKNILPKESSDYLNSDLTEFKRLFSPISIIFSIIIAFLIVFDLKEFKGTKLSKFFYIIYIGMMSYLSYPFASDIVLTIGIKLNGMSNNGTVIKKFKVAFKEKNNDLNYMVWGKIPNKTYDGRIDNLKVTKKDYELISENQELELKLENGLFKIPFNPIIKK
ncbi:hypothetical protein [Winogradskyella helgolandensis]|jgi:hypothetical protein|uniref:hypothetical protein n=1 Tax=Winogradskyella helgolandensis TaxID=2697010 RepID=UPI0015BD6837|nr:hypothetical protein [Winogradskyella helgolandensis]